MEQFVETIFDISVSVMRAMGGFTTTGYQIVNFLIFVFIQPGLALFFFWLWRKEVKSNKQRSL